MHWTAFLAYRRIPANSMVIGDVGCIHCGYNLRGLRAAGNCPECGNLVRDSLYVLAKPDVVAQSLRSFANSYLTFFFLALGCMSLMSGWPAMVAWIAVTCGAAYRAWSAGELRFRAQLQNSQALYDRAKWLWFASLTETFAALLCGAIAVASVQLVPAAALANTMVVTFTVWLVIALLNALAAGWFGRDLARIVGYEWIAIELRLQSVAIAIAIGLLLLSVFLVTLSTARSVAILILSLNALIMLGVFGFTWVTIHQVANAAERVSGSIDDLIDLGHLAMGNSQSAGESHIQIESATPGPGHASRSATPRGPKADYRP